MKYGRISYCLLVICLPLVSHSCEKGVENAQAIVDRSLKEHGVQELEDDSVRFTFRDHRYLHYQNEGRFHYERYALDSSKEYRDVLNNGGFTRYRNGEAVELKKADSLAYAEAINSVNYFAFLPYRLNDPAAKKEHIGQDTVEGTPYDIVRVTFRKEGGGKDHQDIFIYWFRERDARMDFLAYRYFRDDGGVRFREAFGRRRLEGTLIQHYHNFKASKRTDLKKLAEHWEKEELEKVSEIRTENVKLQ